MQSVSVLNKDDLLLIALTWFGLHNGALFYKNYLVVVQECWVRSNQTDATLLCEIQRQGPIEDFSQYSEFFERGKVMSVMYSSL